MSQTIASPPATPSSHRRRRQSWWRDPESRSILIGLVAAVIFHLLLWLVGPRVFKVEPRAVARTEDGSRDFNIELAPEVTPPPKPADPTRFVETNPEAPENTPDKTNNFAAQNQQVAQEKPTPDGTSDRPATEGKKDIESNQIVSGRLLEPIERIEAQPPAPEVPAAETPVAPPRAEQNPLSGTDKLEGENKTGIGTNLAKRLENARAVPEHIEGAKDASSTDTPMSTQPAIDPRRPRPRPQVVRQQQVRPAILAENNFGTKNVGLTAIDARWSNYGAYLQKMVDTVQIQWERLILSMPAMPSRGSTVTVKFVMNDEGKITEIRDYQTTANETGTRACISAITDRSPYGPWTDDMKTVLGTQQEMTFTFHYQ